MKTNQTQVNKCTETKSLEFTRNKFHLTLAENK